ncbi:MAG: fibrobacter succinogenes major paralogous domain-containing protein, partial [Paludibacter sp.]
ILSSCDTSNLPDGAIAGTVKDVDGNKYHTVKIGTQIWMVENLKTTKYNDGTPIPNITNNIEWVVIRTPAYCWYENDANSYKNTYGALYNFYVINTGKLAPKGWHIPTNAEWDTLINYVSNNQILSSSISKALASTSNWYIHTSLGSIGNDLTKNNNSGFSALPGGCRGATSGDFFSIGIEGYWWADEGISIQGTASSKMLTYSSSRVYQYNYNVTNGLSVRCIKD